MANCLGIGASQAGRSVLGRVAATALGPAATYASAIAAPNMYMASLLDGPNVRSGAADQYVGMMGEAMPEEDYAGLADLLGVPEASQALDDEYYDFDKEPNPYSELDDFEAQNAGSFIPEEEKGIFSLGDILADLGRKGVEGFKDVAGRGIGFNVGTNAGYMVGGIPVALAGGVLGALKGGDMFNKNTLSQRTFDSMTPGQQSYTSGLYGRQSDGTPGLLEGYNQISGTGKGAIGTLGDRLSTIQNTLTKQGANPSTVLQQREQQIKDAINRSINIGEREALADPNKNVGGIRTDIDVADGGAETSNGKSIVCTAMYQTTGLQDWAKAMKVWYIYQKRHLSDAHQEGYHLLFKPFVKGMHKNKIIRAVGAHVAKHRTQELKHILFNSKSDTLGKIYNKILEPICYIVGKIKFIFKKK